MTTLPAFAYVASEVSTEIIIRVDGVNTTYTDVTYPGANLGVVAFEIAIAGATLVVSSASSPKLRRAELRFRVLKVEGGNVTPTQVLPVLDDHNGPLYGVIRLNATYDADGVRTNTFRYAPSAATVALRNMFSSLEPASSYELHVAYVLVYIDCVQEIEANSNYDVATFTTA